MLKPFRLKTDLYQFDTCEAFVEAFTIGEGDVILTNPTYYKGYFDHLIQGAKVVFYEAYGKGEPTEPIVEAIYKDLENVPFQRMIAIGGGTIIDVAKLLVQETVVPIARLYDKTIPTKKSKSLMIVPTTCGTGSEVTSVSVIDVGSLGSKMGLQTDDLFPDVAILIPQMIEKLPYKVFATSSIDAIIHAIESYLSPKATPMSEMFSKAAIQMILRGYRSISTLGQEARINDLEDYMLASTYAGIAFGNAGCAAVHAMSMPLGGIYHVPHGESNYCLLSAVLKAYELKAPEGKMVAFKALIAEVLGVVESEAMLALEALLEVVLPYKTLDQYGVKSEEIDIFTEIVMTKQGRLMANNYTMLEASDIKAIYESIYNAPK